MKVLLNLILGHRAVIREHKTPEGFTHDWEVFVRGDQGPIEAFVDRVIFNIHESFPKPKRVVKEPPFVVKESGYAGFMIDIEVLFKTKEEPKRADFKYDLYLQSDGGPISPTRREKLIFNFPGEEFQKKLIKAGGIVYDKLSPSSSSGGSSSSYVASNPGGGKSSKHPVTNVGAKSSPKNSFENLFGTPIKRSGPSLITSTSSSAGPSGTIPGPSKDIKPKTGKGAGGGKPDKVFETIIKTEKGLSKGQKSSSSSLEDSPAEGMVSKPSYKSSKSSSKGGKVATKNMLPPNSPLVPKKNKKSDIFEHSNSSSDERKRKSEKVKKKKHSRSKMDPVVVMIKKERIPNLSPISSTSSRSPSSSQTSPDDVPNSDEDSDSASSDSKMVPAISSTSGSLPRKRSSMSQSPTSIDSPASASSSSSSSSIPPEPKRRKHSSPSPSPQAEEPSSSRRDRPVSSTHKEKKKSKNKKSSHSSSELRKSRRASSISSPSERDRRIYVVSAPAEPSTATSSSSRSSRKSSKKSKKSGGKVKVFEDTPSSSTSDSESESSDSPLSSSPPTENGIFMVNTNGGCSTPTFNHASIAGNITAEMKLLKELHTKIHALEDPVMLQNIVDIVEGCGKDHWSIDSGKTFDFDLCKLSSAAIKRLQKAIFFN